MKLVNSQKWVFRVISKKCFLTSQNAFFDYMLKNYFFDYTVKMSFQI